MILGNCKVCGKPLNEAQYKRNRQYKSCPKCSANNGKEHVYYKYPDDFGKTPKRATSGNPDGPQSYCVPCRGRGGNGNGILCSEF